MLQIMPARGGGGVYTRVGASASWPATKRALGDDTRTIVFHSDTTDCDSQRHMLSPYEKGGRSAGRASRRQFEARLTLAV